MPGRAGFNCTFKNSSELYQIRNLTLNLAKKYQPLSLSGRRTYDFEFLKLVTSNKDLMSEDTYDAIFDIVKNQVARIKNPDFVVGDNTDAEKSLHIVSNMIEFLQDQNFKLNRTKAWSNMTNPEAYKAELESRMGQAMNLTKQIRNATLQRLSFLQKEISFQSRMFSFRQILSNQDSILSIPATVSVKKQATTFVKISPANFKNSNVPLKKEFITETIEYAVNPFQLNNTDNIAANVFEVNLYNFNKTVTDTFIDKVEVSNLTTPIEFAFPVGDNQNLTEFVDTYTTLSNFKYKEK